LVWTTASQSSGGIAGNALSRAMPALQTMPYGQPCASTSASSAAAAAARSATSNISTRAVRPSAPISSATASASALRLRQCRTRS